MKSDGCENDEEDIEITMDHAYSHSHPILEFDQEKLEKALARKVQEGNNICQKTRRFPTNMADINNALKQYDLDAAEFDKVFLEKVAPFDDEWELKPEDEARLDEWRIFIEKHLSHRIDPNLLLLPEVRSWFFFMPDYDNPDFSKYL